MKLTAIRFAGNDDTSLSLLWIDKVFECFGLEDERREVKVAGETRIPPGTYRITLRDEGGMTGRYRARFPDMHQGMLWLRDVPGFEWVYIHIGNTEDHTEGCLLVGQGCDTGGDQWRVSRSAAAYKALYHNVLDAAVVGDLTIEIVDGD